MILQDEELGEVVVRKSPLIRGRVSYSVAPSGKLNMTVPAGMSDFWIKRHLKKHRAKILEMVPVADPATQRTREYQKKVLAKKAREVLPGRLEFLAGKYGYKYTKCRLSNAKSRWGSCTSKGVISLNISLVKLPEELRDYVIIHELAHLNHMDHSKAFWAEVAEHDRDYKAHEKKVRHMETAI